MSIEKNDTNISAIVTVQEAREQERERHSRELDTYKKMQESADSHIQRYWRTIQWGFALITIGLVILSVITGWLGYLFGKNVNETLSGLKIAVTNRVDSELANERIQGIIANEARKVLASNINVIVSNQLNTNIWLDFMYCLENANADSATDLRKLEKWAKDETFPFNKQATNAWTRIVYDKEAERQNNFFQHFLNDPWQHELEYRTTNGLGYYAAESVLMNNFNASKGWEKRHWVWFAQQMIPQDHVKKFLRDVARTNESIELVWCATFTIHQFATHAPIQNSQLNFLEVETILDKIKYK